MLILSTSLFLLSAHKIITKGAKNMKDNKNTVKKHTNDNTSVFPRVVAYSNRQAIISGCDTILEYGEKEIRLDCKKVTLTLKGTDLVIDSYLSDEVRVSGIIALIEFT